MKVAQLSNRPLSSLFCSCFSLSWLAVSPSRAFLLSVSTHAPVTVSYEGPDAVVAQVSTTLRWVTGWPKVLNVPSIFVFPSQTLKPQQAPTRLLRQQRSWRRTADWCESRKRERSSSGYRRKKKKSKVIGFVQRICYSYLPKNNFCIKYVNGNVPSTTLLKSLLNYSQGNVVVINETKACELFKKYAYSIYIYNKNKKDHTAHYILWALTVRLAFF